MSHRPMQGVRVLELSQYTFAPTAGAVLADWGADVIKVEHAETGDAQRGIRVGWNSERRGSFQPIMEHPNRGKRSIGLDVGSERGREILYALAATCDVFITNFLPDARDRLKVNAEEIRRANPAIIYVRATAYGNKGALSSEGGFDSSVFWARMGSGAGVTPPDSPRTLSMPGPAYGDTIGGMTIAGGIAAALFSRVQTGEPAVLDVSLLSVGAWAMGLAIDISLLTGTTRPVASLRDELTTAPTNPLAGDYRTSDDRWINISFLQPGRYWRDFCAHIDRPDLAEDPRFDTAENLMANAKQAAAILRAELAGRTFAEWVAVFQTLRGQWAPVQNSIEAGRDDQLRSNGYIVTIEDADGQPRELVANPVQFNETPPTLTRAPLFAEHTDEILQQLGYDDEHIIELKIAGVVT
ncbi:CoA transferase [Mycobacterium sp. CVI_P3]|uniref:CoA transferase n=1 Tax=Mycobacterium pinniadriaticum TaxID=2994102 RepID=A0ABT3SG83_9MYCO|nr:CoA transferase [Mycobacterium pinniadriaticum]MCX2931771.1 CoA transferase [Mycobacterium pinniadriaticum]MCX2938154.1 CoA transferase [Mycobacterium pinniadriaticum]